MAIGAAASIGSNLLSSKDNQGETGLGKVINPFGWGKGKMSGGDRVKRVFDPFGWFSKSSGEGGDGGYSSNVYDGGGDFNVGGNQFGYRQLPDYETSSGAREGIWDRLQQWGDDPNYGGISPDWADIWDRAQNKVKQYYWGSATTPGLINKVKSSTSGRGVGESPAREEMIGRMGIQEAGDYRDTAQQQAISQAEFGERARNNWMQNMFGLSNQKPSYMQYGYGDKGEDSNWMDALGGMDFSKILGMFGNKDTTSNIGYADPKGSGTGSASSYPGGYSDMAKYRR